MRSCRYTPAAPLSAFIHCFWYWESAPRPHAKEKLLPNGEPAIIFNLRDQPIRIYDPGDLNKYQSYGRAVLSGARSDCFVIDTDQQECVLGIQFRPGGAFPFFQMPASEAEGRSVDLEDLWPVHAREIREQLLAARSVSCMFQLLERRLLQQLVRPLELHPAVSYALREFQASTHNGQIATVTNQIGLSARRFIELFRRQIGLTPKVFCRVLRFQRVLQTIRTTQDIDWADLALSCGYYDQAHFIHDFHSFSGLTPSSYVLAATPNLNHVSLS
jgi:AraC-like DNA-binding protein